MLTVGSRITGKAIDVDYLGQGIVKHEEFVIFVKGMITDEVADIKITKLKKHFAEGVIVSLIERSNDRRHHEDEHLGSMDLIHMSDELQLLWQTKLTSDTLKKIADLDVTIEHIVTDHQFFNYRNKAVFHVMNRDQLSLGLYHEDGRGLYPIDHFVLSDSLTNHIIHILNQAKVLIDYTTFKQIAIRTNLEGEALVTLISTKKSFRGLKQMIDVLKEIKGVIGITLNIKDMDKRILGSKSFLMYGQSVIHEKVGTFSFPVTDQSFFQINVPVINIVYEMIKKHMIKNKKVIDAYSGVGSIGYYLSDQAKEVIMIESNIDACQMAEKVREEKHLKHVKIISGQVEKKIQEEDGDILIVDPPRNGLMPELVDHMLEKDYQQIFYLSCDLKTLARDLKRLHEKYNIKKVYPIRMFPQTTECETLVILEYK
ncbi:MAG: 23S rRNA (uracil(1939)-C(5))-methyltransferase RlmD [Acholeplasmataceae bacterium]|jgi:23S rRNA (uracil1939-C5)-methyltransferase|nr:23S rRNA (uracil(1939)-C(5))-methyltransferase RlmD [Acholeplasmataceae bacterium]